MSLPTVLCLLAFCASMGRVGAGGVGADIPPLYNSCEDEAPDCAQRVQKVIICSDSNSSNSNSYNSNSNSSNSHCSNNNTSGNSSCSNDKSLL